MREKTVELYCVKCGNSEDGTTMKCSKCGGMIETSYNLESSTYNGSKIVSDSFFERFWDFLPIKDYASVEYDSSLKTPTIRAKEIEKIIGGPELWLKNETDLPTKSTKDRMAVVVFPFLRERGVKEFVMSSTGNSSTSIAYFAQFYKDMFVHIFVGKDFVNRLKVYSDNVKVHIVDGDFVSAGKFGMEYAQKNKIHWEGGFFNPARRDGLKTSYLEAVMEMEKSPDYYFQAVSSAMGVVGVNKAAEEANFLGLINKNPSLFCIQQESCAPMVSAWNDRSEFLKEEHIVNKPKGIASAILRGNPTNTYPILQKLVNKSNGEFIMVTEEEIYEAKTLLYNTEGIWACEAASTSLAGYIKSVKLNLIPKNRDISVLINITGGDRNSFILE